MLSSETCSQVQPRRRLPAAFRSEVGALPASNLLAEFDRFYAARLRPCPGARLRAARIRDLFVEWAEARRCSPLTYWELRFVMERKGHLRFYSNGATYRDVRLAAPGEAPAAAQSSFALPEASGLAAAAELNAAVRDCLAIVARIADLIGLATEGVCESSPPFDRRPADTRQTSARRIP